MKSIYDEQIKSIDGSEDLLKQVAGKTCLFVNIASKAGYTPISSKIWSHARTTYHLWELQKVHEEFGHRNFSVVAFPCNQFHGMEPLDNQHIYSYIQKTYPFVTFPISEKIDVNGDDEHPIYTILKGDETRRTSDSAASSSDYALEGQNLANSALSRIPENYEKFIISSNGQLVFRFNFKNRPMADNALTNENDLTIRQAIASLLIEPTH